MPMLDEEEFARIAQLLREGMKGMKEFREGWHLSLEEVPIRELLRPALERYNSLTGTNETNVNAIMHHRLSLYGPPCKRCGKPLRSPRAKLCGACMFPVVE
jgi:hypothetical protein